MRSRTGRGITAGSAVENLVVVGLLLYGATAARAETGTGTEIVNRHSEKCLDVEAGSPDLGADVNQFSCHDGANQKWLLRDRAGGYVAIVSQSSGLCMDVRIGGPKNGTLQQYTCHYRDNQLFRFEQRSDGVRGVRIIAKHSGQCLDVPSPGTDDRVNIQQFPCHVGPNQRWVHADRGPYRFQTTASPIGRLTLSLQAGRAYQFALSGLPAGAPPFMHLWRNGHGNVSPLGPGILPGATTLTYRAAGQGGRYSLFVHAAPGRSPGVAHLAVRRDGSILEQHANFRWAERS